jgi:hypothetical protein
MNSAPDSFVRALPLPRLLMLLSPLKQASCCSAILPRLQAGINAREEVESRFTEAEARQTLDRAKKFIAICRSVLNAILE